VSSPDINPLVDDCGHECAYYAKGEHSVEEMVTGIHRYGEMQNEELTGFQFNPQWHRLETRLFRWVPNREGGSFLEQAKPGRGAFVATVLWNL